VALAKVDATENEALGE